METPPSVWVTQYEDMSKEYGLGFLLSDGSSGVTFKDGTKMALDADGTVFEYVEGENDDSGKNSNETIVPSPSPETIGREPSTTDAVTSAVETGPNPRAVPGAAGEQNLARQNSPHYSRTASRSGGGSGGELQRKRQAQTPQQQRRRRIERIGYGLDDYPARYGKKVTITQKVRELLQRAAGEEDSAAGSTKSVTPPAVKAILPDAFGAFGEGEGWEECGGGADAAAAACGDGGGFGFCFGETIVNPAKAPRTGGEPLVFVEDWKRTRSSWFFRLSNRTLQVCIYVVVCTCVIRVFV